MCCRYHFYRKESEGYRFIHVRKNILSSYYVPGTVLGTEDVVVNKMDAFLLSVLDGETAHNQMVKYNVKIVP